MVYDLKFILLLEKLQIFSLVHELHFFITLLSLMYLRSGTDGVDFNMQNALLRLLKDPADPHKCSAKLVY